MFLISFTSATSIGTFKQNANVEIYQTCNNCTYCNFTKVKYENGTAFLTNVSAIKEGTYYYYNVLGGNHSTFGVYSYCYECGNAAESETGCLNYGITPSGTLFTSALSIPLFLPMVLMLLIMLLWFFLAGFVDKKEYKFTFLIFGGLFLILAIMFGIMASREVLYGFPLLYNFINSFSRIFIIALQVAAIVIPIIVMFFAIKRAFDTRGYNLK